jgi:hypothetical protein
MFLIKNAIFGTFLIAFFILFDVEKPYLDPPMGGQYWSLNSGHCTC